MNEEEKFKGRGLLFIDWKRRFKNDRMKVYKLLETMNQVSKNNIYLALLMKTM